MIPVNDLARAARFERDLLSEAFLAVVDSGWFVLGHQNVKLEADLVEYVGGGHVALVGNGTDALQIAMQAVGVTAGANVLTVANAGGYSTAAINALGATPCYADVDPDTFLMSVETLGQAWDRLKVRPAAIIVTHLFGTIAPIAEIVAWARERRIPVVEDVAQALGGTADGQRVGTFGDIATVSFYPTKNLGALGDGGAIISSTPELDRRVRQLRQYGWHSKYVVAEADGRNSRMDEMQAAFVRLRLPRLDDLNHRRRLIHERYERASEASRHRMVGAVADEGFVAHLAVLDVSDRTAAQAHFARLGIGTDVHYPIPDHRQVATRADVILPVTEKAAARVLSLPMFPELEDSEVEAVADAIARLDPGP